MNLRNRASLKHVTTLYSDNGARRDKFPSRQYNNLLLSISIKGIMVIIPSGFFFSEKFFTTSAHALCFRHYMYVIQDLVSPEC
jgi:hypothetical protein